MFILSPTGIAVIDLKGLESLDFLWYLRQDWRKKKKKIFMKIYQGAVYGPREICLNVLGIFKSEKYRLDVQNFIVRS